jgi:hypothetical protein
MNDTDTTDGIIRNPIDGDGPRGGWPVNGGSLNGGPRRPRCVSDEVLIAFHYACDQGDIEVAVPLLEVLEFMTKWRRSTPLRDRRSRGTLVAAHERLWALRHPELS